MPRLWPGGLDNFNVPNSPGSIALSSSGTGSRNHVQHHQDMGDAIEAMQAQATRAAHSHDGSTARHGSKLSQVNTHQSVDTDVAAGSIHHTLGHGATQAAPGNHSSLPAFSDTHAGSVAWPVGSVFMTTVAGNPSGAPHNLGGTWTQIQDAFLIGAGGSYTYSGSVVSNATTHTHTIADTTSDGSHVHQLTGTIDTYGVHSHTSAGTGGTAPTHTHTSSSTSGTTHLSGSAGATNAGMTGHSHTLPSGGGANHAHSSGGVANNGAGHSHTATGDTSTQSSHSHTESASTVSHAPPWLAVYTWQRTA